MVDCMKGKHLVTARDAKAPVLGFLAAPVVLLRPPLANGMLKASLYGGFLVMAEVG